MGRNRVVQPKTTRLNLVDVHKRAHAALLKRTKPKATPEDIAASAQRVADAESDADWIVVRSRLNAGENLAYLDRMSSVKEDGSLKLNPKLVGPALVAAYLLDWSLCGPDGEKIDITPIDYENEDSVKAMMAAVLSIDMDDFIAVKNAIEDHHSAIASQRDAAKNGLDGESEGSAISPSPSGVAGASSGSVN